MPQIEKIINYLEEKKSNKITNYAGILPLLDFIKKIGIFKFADNKLNIRSGSQGWYDSQQFLSIFSINFIGGDCISDVDILESDSGLTSALPHIEKALIGKRKKEISKRFRKGRQRIFPSDNSIHNYALEFHNEEEEERRKDYILKKEAFIPKCNNNLEKLKKIFGILSNFAQENNPVNSATIDIDASIVNSNKRSAFYTYKKDKKGYHPMNAYWNEQQMILFSEFRDGNVPPSYKITEFVKESFSYLPKGINKLFLRSDSAGYNHELMNYCENKGIKFSISSKISKIMKEEVKVLGDNHWSKIKITREQMYRSKFSNEEFGWEWTELEHISEHPQAGNYRYIAIRSKIPEERYLFEEVVPVSVGESGDDKTKKQYRKNGTRYNLRVIVTNRYDIDGEGLFHWHNKRCGYSEQVHDVMKNEFGGGQLPSDKFGANAFWWLMMIYSLNIIQLYKTLMLDNCWRSRRMKAFRLHFIYLSGRIIERSCTLFVYLKNKLLFEQITLKIINLREVPI